MFLLVWYPSFVTQERSRKRDPEKCEIERKLLDILMFNVPIKSKFLTNKRGKEKEIEVDRFYLTGRSSKFYIDRPLNNSSRAELSINWHAYEEITIKYYKF